MGFFNRIDNIISITLLFRAILNASQCTGNFSSASLYFLTRFGQQDLSDQPPNRSPLSQVRHLLPLLWPVGGEGWQGSARQILFLWDGDTHDGVQNGEESSETTCNLYHVCTWWQKRGKKSTSSIPCHHPEGWQGHWHPAPHPDDFSLPWARAHTLTEHINTICLGTGRWCSNNVLWWGNFCFPACFYFQIGFLVGKTGRNRKYSSFLISQTCRNQQSAFKRQSKKASRQHNITRQHLHSPFSLCNILSHPPSCSHLPTI